MGSVSVWFRWTPSAFQSSPRSVDLDHFGGSCEIVKQFLNGVQPTKRHFYIFHTTFTLQWCIVPQYQHEGVLFVPLVPFLRTNFSPVWMTPMAPAFLCVWCSLQSSLKLFSPLSTTGPCSPAISPFALHQALSPHPPPIPYLLSFEVCPFEGLPCGSRLHCGSRRKEWFRAPQPRHFPPEQPLTRAAINHWAPDGPVPGGKSVRGKG